MSKAPDPTRRLVYDTLLSLEQGRSRRVHIEDKLNQGFEKYELPAESRRFGTFLSYGILRHWFALTHLIGQFSKVPLKKLTPRARLLLRMGFYQLHAMEGVPDFAAVASTMALAEALGETTKSRGLINAILQTFIRQEKPWPTEPSQLTPTWWLKRLEQHYSPEAVTQIMAAQAALPTLALRVNTLKTTVEAYHELLRQAEIPFEVSETVPESLRILTPQGNPTQLPGFAEGLFLVQDEASTRVSRFLDPQPGDTVLEIGAAPGTKTTHLGALMQNQGQILAVDVSEERMASLHQNLERLGVTCAVPQVMDASQREVFATLQVDKILVDAPCSGSGTLGKHPEILLTLQPKDFNNFAKDQSRLLTQAFKALKVGGVMVYSTCSLDPAENQQVLKGFLRVHAETAALESEEPWLPTVTHDGFYMARLRRTAEAAVYSPPEPVPAAD